MPPVNEAGKTGWFNAMVAPFRSERLATNPNGSVRRTVAGEPAAALCTKIGTRADGATGTSCTVCTLSVDGPPSPSGEISEPAGPLESGSCDIGSHEISGTVKIPSTVPETSSIDCEIFSGLGTSEVLITPHWSALLETSSSAGKGLKVVSTVC